MRKGANYAHFVVARQGISAWLVALLSAIMGFLSIYALSLGLFANSMAKNWEVSLGRAASLRIIAQDEDIESQTAAALEVLRSSAGIHDIKEREREDQLALLKPWLGDEIPSDVLLLPRFYSVTIDPEQLDEETLRARLQTEAPGAVWDNHQRWHGPIVETASWLKLISWISILLIGIMYFITVYVAAQASIAANENSIKLLRQIGGSDKWIQSGFLQKIILRGVVGNLVGIALALLIYMIFIAPALNRAEALGARAQFGNLVPGVIAIIAIAALASYISTKWSTRRYLEKTR